KYSNLLKAGAGRAGVSQWLVVPSLTAVASTSTPLAIATLLLGLVAPLVVSPALANTPTPAGDEASQVQASAAAVAPNTTDASHTTNHATLPGRLDLSSWKINFPGGLGLVQLPPGSENAIAYFNGRRVLVVRTGEALVALVGLNAEAKPGQYALELHPMANPKTQPATQSQTGKKPQEIKGTGSQVRTDAGSQAHTDAGSQAHTDADSPARKDAESPAQTGAGAQLHAGTSPVQMLAFTVIARDYPTVKFDYPRKYASFDKPTLARIGREKRELTKLKKTWSPSTPDLGFAWPASGRISSVYGSRRVFQDRTSVHSGLDIARAIGTKVSATAPGKVLVAANYYFTGKTILIDHGSGVLSLYAHLNDMFVKEGQKVAKGELIGHIGTTGRSTGPHLHFAIGFNGQWIDPITVLPAKPAKE
ncbi:MAG: peptidoglycan DD-metalloendopeptidase family protein, partial [Proteobacteria bacterium]|nr:peptidoglycan DD-metalloendopeptidase family protein [Pseudomonadota bacterium]